MTAEQPLAELTTRDVLLQLDRRMSLVEEDVRDLDAKLDSKFDALDAKLDTKIDALDTKFSAKLDNGLGALDNRLSRRLDALDARLDTKFHLLIGLLLTSWLSTMAAVLLK